MEEGVPLIAPVAAQFQCDRCGRLASTISLLPAGVPDPQARGEDHWYPSPIRISIDGPIHSTHAGPEPGHPGVQRLARAISAGDPAILYDLDIELAPFWCPSCALIYCGSCLSIWVEYDEGFYDDTRGRCPAGHERILDD